MHILKWHCTIYQLQWSSTTVYSGFNAQPQNWDIVSQKLVDQGPVYTNHFTLWRQVYTLSFWGLPVFESQQGC